jgi:hypothetical protein
MKENRLVFTVLLLLSAAVFQLRAQKIKTDQKPLEEVKAKAEAGDADSENRLGLRYANGRGVAKDYVEAVKWYRKAAEQNDADAQNNLGNSYHNGQGVAKDKVEGYKWWLLAAGQGDESAKRNMTKGEFNMTREQIAEGQKLARNFKPLKEPSSKLPPAKAGGLMGRSYDECVSRLGNPFYHDGGKLFNYPYNVYFFGGELTGGFGVEVLFYRERASAILYGKGHETPLTPGDIEGIFTAYGDGQEWRELKPDQFVRADDTIRIDKSMTKIIIYQTQPDGLKDLL